ncbi:MAG: ABC transporter permease [Chthoniobacterales bacterium]
MSNLVQGFRYAVRTLLKQPGFTFIAVVTLALGIGANTAIFSVINSVLLAPLPYPAQDRLVVISETDKVQGGEFAISLPDYLDWRRDATSFENLALVQVDGTSISDIPGQIAEQIPAAFVSANFFKIIGLVPKIGRTFNDDEDRAGAPLVAVISDRLWQRKFARSPAILGQTLMLQNRPTTIIGVMPPEMNAPGDVDAWFSVMRRADNPAWPNRLIHPNLYAWARLKNYVSLDQARTEMRGIAARIEQANPDTNKDVTALLTPVLESMVGKYRTNLALLLGAVALVLLIACANLANLFAVRGAGRAREFAIRAAVGASRSQLVRQLLIESLVVAFLGGTLGFLAAMWGRDLLALVAPQDISRFQQISFNAPVLIFTFALTTLTSVLSGLLPAWQSSRADIQLALKSGAQTASETKAARRTRDLLVIADVALTLVLLSSAGLVLKSFARMQSLALGFQPRGLTTARLTLPYSTYRGRETVAKFGQAVIDKVAALPGIEKVALGGNPPLLAGWMVGFHREDLPTPPPNEEPGAESEVVAGDYLGALQTNLLRGRVINERDNMQAPLVCMIDQALAEKYFPNEDPIGKHLSSDPDGNGNENRSFEVVGIVSRIKFHGAEPTPPRPVIYFSLGQTERHRLILLVRSALPAHVLEKSLRDAVASVDPRQPVYEIHPMSDLVAQTWATQRLLTFLLSIFAGLALGLASIGLYGVLAYTTLKRVREIGIRIALGARPAQVGALIMNHALRLLSLGCIFGLIGALVASRALQSVLFEAGRTDLQVYFIVGGILLLATLLASWLPTRRACKVDPIVALRSE